LLGQWKASSHFNQQWSITAQVSSNGRESSSELNTEKIGIKIYPNPFTKNFTLEVPRSGGPLQITILDSTGKVVETVIDSGSSTKLSLGSALKPGLYLIRINSINGSQSLKVLKE
jgi:hypothetical protein